MNFVHYDIRQGKAKLCVLKLTSVSHHLPSVIPKQLCALAHLGCTCKVGTYFLVMTITEFQSMQNNQHNEHVQKSMILSSVMKIHNCTNINHAYHRLMTLLILPAVVHVHVITVMELDCVSGEID